MTDETWKKVPGFSDYEASESGCLRKGGRRIAANVGSHGYLMVNMKGDDGKRGAHLLHVVIATAFHGPRPENLDCCHNDGDPYNVAKYNLRWDTRKNNIADQKKHGTFKWHGRKKLQPQDIASVRERLAKGETAASIAAEYGVHHTTINAVDAGRSWTEVTGLAPGKSGSRERARGAKIHGKLDDEKVKQIIARLDSGDKQADIAEAFGVRRQTISNINVGLCWSWLTKRGAEYASNATNAVTTRRKKDIHQT